MLIDKRLIFFIYKDIFKQEMYSNCVINCQILTVHMHTQVTCSRFEKLLVLFIPSSSLPSFPVTCLDAGTSFFPYSVSKRSWG